MDRERVQMNEVIVLWPPFPPLLLLSPSTKTFCAQEGDWELEEEKEQVLVLIAPGASLAGPRVLHSPFSKPRSET